MNHLPFTLAAYFFNTLAVLANKFLLSQVIPDPLIYIFYISLISFLAVFALPLTKIPTPDTFFLASLSTLFWTLGAYLMFKALKLGQISRVIPIIGTLIPLILLVFASQTNAVTLNQAWAVWILILGMVFLTITDWRSPVPPGTRQDTFSKKELILEISSAAFFALSYILLRQAYLSSDFFSVLVWSRLILLPVCLILLLIPKIRSQIILSLTSRSLQKSANSLIFLGGQFSGVISELLILFSISLANPALVNSLQGTQYVFLLILAAVLAKKYPSIFAEKYTPKVILSKFIGIILIGVGLYLIKSA